MKPYLFMYPSKRKVDIFELRAEDVDIRDIAHHLALINRFNGGTIRPLSVAQHSVYVYRLCLGTKFEKQALLHDAAEAYVGDVTKWLKHSPEMAHFRKAEERVQKIILEKYGCPTELAKPVLDADRLMVRFEGNAAIGKHFEIDHPDYPRINEKEKDLVGPWTPWTFETAEAAFLGFAKRLGID